MVEVADQVGVLEAAVVEVEGVVEADVEVEQVGSVVDQEDLVEVVEEVVEEVVVELEAVGVVLRPVTQ